MKGPVSSRLTPNFLVFAAISSFFADFNLPDAENLKLQSEQMIAVKKWVEDSGLTQAEAAKQLKTTQPRLNDLLKG